MNIELTRANDLNHHEQKIAHLISVIPKDLNLFQPVG